MAQNKSKFKKIWSEIRWILIGIFWLLSLLIGYAGFSIYARENQLPLTITDRIYQTLQLISMNSGAVDGVMNWLLDLARFLIPALTAFTALQAVTELFREQMQWLRLWGLKDHIIICGLGRKGSYLVEDLLSHDKKILVIEDNLEPATANEYRRKGILILEGNATEIDTLERARLLKASHLVCFLGDDQENLIIAQKANAAVRQNTKQNLTCILHLASKNLFDLVKRSELNLTNDDPFLLEPFNTYERISNQLIHNDPVWHVDAEKPAATIMIIGIGRLGQNLCRQAAYTWYRHNHTQKLNIIAIDKDANQKINQIMMACPKIEAVCDFIPIQADLSSNLNLLKTLPEQNIINKIDRVYICIGNALLSLQVCLTLERVPELNNIPIYVRMEKNSGLSEILQNPIAASEEQENIMPFDIYEQTCSAELVLGGRHELLALKLRENYLRNLETPTAEQLLDLPWEEVPEEEKEANRQQAKRIHQILRDFNYRIETLDNWDAGDYQFTEDEIKKMSVLEHDLWCQWKRDNNWRYGKQRNDRLRTNPDLVPWDRLTTDEQLKTIAFIRSLPELLADLGFQINQTPV